MELLDQARTDGITQIVLRGSFDMKAANDLNLRLHTIVAARRQPAVIDIAGVDFISSIGMGVLVACASSLRRHGMKLALAAPTSMVRDALVAARLEAVMLIADSVESALQLVNESQHSA